MASVMRSLYFYLTNLDIVLYSGIISNGSNVLKQPKGGIEMKLVLDLDGTVYGPSGKVRDAVVRRLKRTLTTLSNSGETLDKCISRLGSKYGTKSLTMMICLETGSNQESVVEATYVPDKLQDYYY